MALPLDNGSDQTALNRFFEPEEALPTFTQALRGYHKDEVDQYLRELRDTREEEAQALADAEIEVRRLRSRVSSLERTLQDETPHTIEALGERVVLILRHAEEGANETLARAQEEADRLCREARERADAFVRQASLRATQAAQELKNARGEAEALVQRAEAEAHERASSMIEAAEAQAAAHLADAERRATEMREGAEADRRQTEVAIQTMRARAEAELERLAARRRQVLESLDDLQGTIASALHSQWNESEVELPGGPSAPSATGDLDDGYSAGDDGDDEPAVAERAPSFEEGDFFFRPELPDPESAAHSEEVQPDPENVSTGTYPVDEHDLFDGEADEER